MSCVAGAGAVARAERGAVRERLAAALRGGAAQGQRAAAVRRAARRQPGGEPSPPHLEELRTESTISSPINSSCTFQELLAKKGLDPVAYLRTVESARVNAALFREKYPGENCHFPKQKSAHNKIEMHCFCNRRQMCRLTRRVSSKTAKPSGCK